MKEKVLIGEDFLPSPTSTSKRELPSKKKQNAFVAVNPKLGQTLEALSKVSIWVDDVERYSRQHLGQVMGERAEAEYNRIRLEQKELDLDLERHRRRQLEESVGELEKEAARIHNEMKADIRKLEKMNEKEVSKISQEAKRARLALTKEMEGLSLKQTQTLEMEKNEVKRLSEEVSVLNQEVSKGKANVQQLENEVKRLTSDTAVEIYKKELCIEKEEASRLMEQNSILSRDILSEKESTQEYKKTSDKYLEELKDEKVKVMRLVSQLDQLSKEEDSQKSVIQAQEVATKQHLAQCLEQLEVALRANSELHISLDSKPTDEELIILAEGIRLEHHLSEVDLPHDSIRSQWYYAKGIRSLIKRLTDKISALSKELDCITEDRDVLTSVLQGHQGRVVDLTEALETEKKRYAVQTVALKQSLALAAGYPMPDTSKAKLENSFTA